MAATTETAEVVTTEVEDESGSDRYVLPVLHVKVPDKMVNLGFWGGLTGAVVSGAVDLPVGVLVGAGVVIARHRMKR